MYRNLPPGTILKNKLTNRRLNIKGMVDVFAKCTWIKKDGTPDLRRGEWAGSLSKEDWKICFK